MKNAPATTNRGLSRRSLLRGTAVGAASVALAGGRPLRAESAEAPQSYVPQPGASQIGLRVATTPLSPDGGPVVDGITANGTFPGPEIRLRRGDQVRIPVANALAKEPTAMHWHGLLVPAGMDGVPDVSNTPVPAGGVYVYEFPLRQSGTYWYHSHFGFQEQVGLAGPLIIEDPAEPRADHDAVVMLNDWMHGSPAAAYAKLRGEDLRKAKPSGAAMKMDGGAPMKMAGAMPAGGAAMKMGSTPAAGGGGAMKMGGGADLSDIRYDAFLLNGRSANAPWTLAAKPGETIRLRFINAGSSTYFRVRLDGHRMKITHADGMAVEPVEVDHFLIGMAESYDAEVVLSGDGSYTLHAMAQDGSGQAVGVLYTPSVAEISPKADSALPKFDGRELTYADLIATAPTTLPEGPARRYELALGGDMARYIWTINGQAYPKADPLPIAQGERVELAMKNETMMWHPMHLHGHFFRVLQGAGERCPLKHTVNVAPGETVGIEFTADNPGRWFFHCHNLYHLEAGMARVFEYVA